MANNRIYIREKLTGKIFFLGKHFAGPWEMRSTVEELNRWFEEIQHLRGEVKQFDWMHGPTTFEFVYEIAEEDSGAPEL